MYEEPEDNEIKFKYRALSRVLLENIGKCEYSRNGYRIQDPTEVLTVLKSLEPGRFKSKIQNINAAALPPTDVYAAAVTAAEKEQFESEN